MLQTARTVRIQLFGRPQLSEDDIPLKCKAPQRALSLLAFLLTSGPAPLHRDAVAFALWPDDAETDARANLRRHLFYLTNDVLPAPAPKTPWIVADKKTVRWNPAAPVWCDVSEFHRLAADPATYDRAAGLYHGDFLAGFTDEWLDEPRERLREQQVNLLHDLIATSSANADHAAGITYARQLLAIDPWREDAVRSLIDLRAAAGDRAGALASYREFEKRLAAEMGVAPMAETTAAHARVAAAGDGRDGAPPDPPLRRNPHWHEPASIANSEATRPVSSFTGREAEIAAIDESLWVRGAVVAIHGLAGIGKSALAREYARRNRERYAATWWIHADTENGIIDGLIGLGSAFSPEISSLHDRRSAAEHVATNVLCGLSKPVLLVYDNLDDDRLFRCWSPRGAAHVVVTARQAVLGGEIAALRLAVWEADETVRYLQHEIGRSDITPSDALGLADRLGSLPLALAHAAAYLKGTINVSVARYSERIDDHLLRAPRGADYERAVFATFGEAIARAEEEAPGAAALLCFAAQYAADALPEELFDQPAEAYAPLTPRRTATPSTPDRDLRAAIADDIGKDDALGALHRLSLVSFSPHARTYTMHRLVQSAARSMIAHDEPSWTASAIAAVDAAFPDSDYAHWPECERFIAHACSVLDRLPAGAGSPAAARLALRCGRYARARASFGDAEMLLRRSVAIGEAASGPEAGADVAEQSEALAALLRETNRVSEAEPLLRQAVTAYERLTPTHHRLAGALNDLAILLHYAHRFAEAQALFERALAIDEARYDAEHPVIAVRLHNLALVLHELNAREQAEALLRRALHIDERKYGDRHPDVASDSGSLGWLLLDAGRPDEARPLLQRAVTIRESIFGAEHPTYAHAISDIAVLQQDTGAMPEAERQLNVALAIYEARYGPEHPVVAACLNNVAELHARTGRAETAQTLYRRALAADERSFGPMHANVARDLNNLAGLFATPARTRDAIELMQRARTIVERTYAADHPRVQAVAENIALLDRLALDARAVPPGRWRYIRRSPSRGLR